MSDQDSQDANFLDVPMNNNDPPQSSPHSKKKQVRLLKGLVSLVGQFILDLGHILRHPGLFAERRRDRVHWARPALPPQHHRPHQRWVERVGGAHGHHGPGGQLDQ